MEWIKKAVLIVLMTAICASTSVAFAAAAPVPVSTQKYSETALTLPEDYIKNGKDRLIHLSVYGTQIHLITERQSPAGILRYNYFQSEDLGKSWKEQDMQWLEDVMAKSGASKTDQISVSVGKDGAIYALFDLQGQVESPTLGYNYYKGRIVKRLSGQTEELLTLDDPDVVHYQPVGTTMAGENTLVLHAIAQGEHLEQFTGKKTQSAILCLDPTTGKQKSKATFPSRSSPPSYANNRYVIYNDKTLNVCDVTSGRVLASFNDLPDEDGSAFRERWAPGTDGAFYRMCQSGLFRTEQDSGWEQLMDGSVCKKGTAGSNYTSCAGLFVAEDGSTYAILRHIYVDPTTTREECKAYTFSRYAPV